MAGHGNNVPNVDQFGASLLFDTRDSADMSPDPLTDTINLGTPRVGETGRPRRQRFARHQLSLAEWVPSASPGRCTCGAVPERSNLGEQKNKSACASRTAPARLADHNPVDNGKAYLGNDLGVSWAPGGGGRPNIRSEVGVEGSDEDENWSHGRHLLRGSRC